MKVLSFDIGVKNLAWCLTDYTGNAWSIQDWGVWDLRVDLTDEPMRPTECYAVTQNGNKCTRTPHWVEVSGGVIVGGLCKCHKKLSNAPYTSDDIKSLKSQSVSNLRKRAIELGIDPKKKLKKELLTLISDHMAEWCLHTIPPLKNSKTISLPLIHTRILQRLSDIHIQADKVVIENQPSKAHALMKSVQLILWTSLRMKRIDAGMEDPDVTFVNPSKKLTVIPDDSTMCYRILPAREASRQARGRSYADRKKEGIHRVQSLLERTSQTRHLEWFKKNSKRDDLADCLLMCLQEYMSV